MKFDLFEICAFGNWSYLWFFLLKKANEGLYNHLTTISKVRDLSLLHAIIFTFFYLICDYRIENIAVGFVSAIVLFYTLNRKENDRKSI